MEEIVQFSELPVSPEPDTVADYYSVAALALGMAGFLLRLGALSWAGILVMVSSVLAVKPAKRDLTQLLPSFLLALVGLSANYVDFFQGPKDTMPAYALT